METLDPEGTIQDFEKPKTFFEFDPYSGTPEGLGKQSAFDQQLTALKYEDSLKLRASLVLDAYESQLSSISASQLSYEDRERFERVSNLLEYLKTVKVVDAPVLLKIYGMYRCDV